jgi:hypothetical protein
MIDADRLKIDMKTDAAPSADYVDIRIDPTAFAYPDVPLPDVWTVRHKIDAPEIKDVPAAAADAVARLFTDARLRPGASVAVGVGSRGISNLQPIVRTVVERLKARGCQPFIVPAMGSHGDATAEGQTEILHGYGITEAGCGAPIRATMDVELVSTLEDGYPVYFDRMALAADAVVVVNRIKRHTCFQGRIESGLAKMCAIGLGKHTGASSIHEFGFNGLRDTMPRVARRLVTCTNIVGGIGILENAYGGTAEVHGLTANEIGGDREADLLERSRALAPRLAFDDVDVLVVDRMGKDISGSGFDTHVIGRVRMPSASDADWPGPTVRVIVALDLTDQTHGNAAGLGLADIVTRRLIERVDFHATMTNHRTSGEGGAFRSKIPLVLADERAAVQAAIGCCGHGRPETVRLARIQSTAFVETLEISAPLLEEARSRDDIEVLSGPHPMNLSALLAS